MNGLNEAQRLNDWNPKTNNMPSLLLTLIAFVLVSPALAHDGDRQKALLESVAIEERLNNQLPLDLALRDETGAAVSLRHYFNGKPVLLAFVYYDCPQLCPLVLEGLGRSLRVLRLAGEDYQVIAVSIDPAETAALAARKKKAIHGAASWHFLTASAQTIEALTQRRGLSLSPEPKTPGEKVSSMPPILWCSRRREEFRATFQPSTFRLKSCASRSLKPPATASAHPSTIC